MIRARYEVSLVGTWDRPNTPTDEITTFRRQLRVLAAQEGFSASFVVRRGHPYHRHGTFRATVTVRAKNGRRAITFATQFIRNVVGDLVCRSPRVRVDRARSRVRRVWE